MSIGLISAAMIVAAGAAAPPSSAERCRPNAPRIGATWPEAIDETRARRPDAVAALEAYAFPPDEDRADPDRFGPRTDGLVIVHRGRIVYERYAAGYTADTPHLAWSATKTLTGLLAGVAVGQGRLAVDDSICAHLDGLPQASCAVTVDHLLAFASGFDWLETYEEQSPTASSVLAMLYGEGQSDMGRFTARHAVRDAPGSTYHYSSGDTNVLAHVLDAVLRPMEGPRWPQTLLLEPLGITGATWERDGADVVVGSSYLWATPRDLARVGLLLREGGCWNGARLIPAGWVDWMGEVSPAIRNAAWDRSPLDVQGRQLWLNRPIPEAGLLDRPFPQVPADAVQASGHWGQTITAIPSADLVVVRTADTRHPSISDDRFLAHAMAVVGAGPIPTYTERPYEAPASPPVPNPDRRYATRLLGLGAAFAAKEACSCAYVMQRSESFCRDWIRVSPDVARVRFFPDEQRVVGQALGLARTEARFIDRERGCQLVR